MRLSLFLPLLLLSLAFSCNKKVSSSGNAATSNETEALGTMKSITFGSEEMLKVGESCQLEKSAGTLKFLAVVEDSRCPKGVNCIQAGAATIMVEVDGVNRRLTIDADPKTITRTPITGGTVEILSLSPYPEARIRIDPAQRAIRIKIVEGKTMR